MGLLSAFVEWLRRTIQSVQEFTLFSIDVIQVPLAAPQNAKIINRPRIFADPASGIVAGLWPGGDHGPGTQKTNIPESPRLKIIETFPSMFRL